MVTNQVLTSRSLMGQVVRQRTKDSYFNMSDMLALGNRYRQENNLPTTTLAVYLSQKNVKEFIAELKEREGKEVWIKGRQGRKAKDDESAGVWAHPLIFIDFALWVNPKLKIETYNWILDYLVKYRIDSADSYIRMCGALYKHTTNKHRFKSDIALAAKHIKNACGVSGDWNNATQEQLEMRDKMQDNIARLCGVLRDAKRAFEIGILMVKEGVGDAKIA